MAYTTYITYGDVISDKLYPPKTLDAYELITQKYDELFAYIKHEERSRIFSDQEIYNKIYETTHDLTYIIDISQDETKSYLISYIQNTIDYGLANLENISYNSIKKVYVNDIASINSYNVAYININADNIQLSNIPQNTSYITYNDSINNAITKLSITLDEFVKPIILGQGTEIDLNLFK